MTEQHGIHRPNTEQNTSSEEVPVGGRVENMDRTEHRWDLRLTHQLSSDVGKLLESVESLKASVAKLETKIHRIEIIVAGATGAVVVIGYLLDKRFDQIFDAIAKISHP